MFTLEVKLAKCYVIYWRNVVSRLIIFRKNEQLFKHFLQSDMSPNPLLKERALFFHTSFEAEQHATVYRANPNANRLSVHNTINAFSTLGRGSKSTLITSITSPFYP